ncbi:dTDP-glucose 4,6-dehydratase [Lichtheimia ornata]|uniref:dTDP-glucose 4,6-dehydratase n=1 Tax=Lichtheimia ornata TaxID=688661 RepID=A0AAD7XX83_9FUNG|nr:dTDP-glucose 4,6-dehydratase [Lichtheimia ornata]KAJ8656181.1 dTDP-glucose 4,6-dehydratase [Lichtheimia ornata]
MTPPTPTPSSLSSPVISNESHDQHERLCKTVAPFDLVDIGQRIPDLPSDLHNVKSILVTGGAGFIGSFLVRKLVVLYPEYHIYVVDKLDYCGSLHNLKSVAEFPNYTFIKGDITSPDFMAFVLKEKQIDIIFHLAAQTHVDNSFGDSFEFTRNNVMGTHVMLEAAKVHGVKRFIHVSTDEVYGEVVSRPDCREDTILAPTNPYSATKAAAECLVKAYYRSFGLPVMITRSNNVYGPYQYPEKITSKFICSLLRHGKCYIHGDGHNSRKYLYAGDVADALDVIFHRGEVGETYNIGSKFEISNLEFAQRLIKIFGYNQDDHIEFVQDRAFNDKRYGVDFTKLEALGWKPKMGFEEGLRKTIEWYQHRTAEWWGDVSGALVPHPLKALPPPV